MKNNKKISYKNRIKWFYAESENGKNRVKEEREDITSQESYEQEETNDQDLKNPEEEGDFL